MCSPRWELRRWPSGLSSRATGTDLKDCDRTLPNPALQTPRDAGFQELEHVHLLCHLVQSQPTRPPPRRHTPGSCPLNLSCVRCSLPCGDCLMSVCHAEKVGTDPVWAQRRPALFFHFLQHFLSSRVQSKGFHLALRNCCQLVLAWPCSQIAVSWQPSSVFSLPRPACPRACAALVFAPSPWTVRGGPGGR